MGITLNVNGQIITGILISYKKYLKETGSSFGLMNDEHGLGNSLKEVFNQLDVGHEKYLNEQVVASAEDEDASKNANFIHLEDARIIVNKNNINAPLWRGKLSSVDGFIFGTINEN
jgi:hypothetical protein